MLEVNKISFQYNSKPVLNEITFQVGEHEMLAILGPNGAGKTTLLRCINRILKVKKGSVLIEEEDLAGLNQKEIARKTAYVAQWSEPGRVTAFDAVLLGRKPHIQWNVSDHDLEHTQAALKLLDIEHLSLRYLDEMSGGEYQKVCIARAMVQEPAVMLLDEPTSSLDLKNQLAILRLLRTIVKQHRMCSVMSMHDLNTAFRYADKFIFLKNGTIYATVDRSGITEKIIADVYEVPVSISWHQDHPYILPMDE